MQKNNTQNNLKNNKEKNWWKKQAIYQIYPRSFFDTSGNGIGDLKGVSKKLDYIASLGVGAIWLSPFFTSPMKDFGYDVSNYKDVDPIFGNLDDFKELIASAHQKGIKVIIDQVLSHTSNEHPWFLESKKDKKNAKADWYVWAKPKADGSPPNNWQSVFGGSSWTWNSAREEYYLHNFLAEQPDLNFHNLKVQKAILDAVEFWLKIGVDGFRLDTVNFYFHDEKLRSNPPTKVKSTTSTDVNPYTYQLHKYDKSQPENLAFLKKLRKLMDRYGATTTIGEVGDDHRGLEIISEYTKDNDKLHMAYGFDFLTGRPRAEDFKKKLLHFKKIVADGWICWSFGNHDVTRPISRWASAKELAEGESSKGESSKGGGKLRDNLAKMLLALLGALPGSMCIYQGEELGLEEAVLKYEDIVDPFGINLYPKFVGRDGCRTPMVWDGAAKNGGFSKAKKTWLPVYDKHLPYAANKQNGAAGSILNFYRDYLSLRNEDDVITSDDFKIVEATGATLVLTKSYSDKSYLFAFNLDKKKISYQLPSKYQVAKIVLSNNATLKNKQISLQQYGFFYGELA